MAIGNFKGGYWERERFGEGIEVIPASRMAMSEGERRSVVDDEGEEVVVGVRVDVLGVGMRVDVLDAVLFQRGRAGREMGRMGWGAMMCGSGDAGAMLLVARGGATRGELWSSECGGGGAAVVGAAGMKGALYGRGGRTGAYSGCAEYGLGGSTGAYSASDTYGPGAGTGMYAAYGVEGV
jgi:hypothetical protein